MFLFNKLVWSYSSGLIIPVRHLLARYTTAYGCVELSSSSKETTQVKYIGNDVFICEQTFGTILNIFRRHLSIQSNILTHYIGGIYINLISQLGHTALDTTEMTVSRTQISNNSLSVVGLIQIDEVLVDSVEQITVRNEITQTSILMSSNDTTQIDFSRVTSKDVHAAIIARRIIQISNHHFGRYWNLCFARLYWIALSIAIDCTLLQISYRDQWSSVWWPWLTALADISTFTEKVCLSHRLEYEADRGAMELAVKAGYNPLGMLWLLEYQARQETTADSWWALMFGSTSGMFCSTPLNRRRQQELVKVMEQHYQGSEKELLL